MAKFNKVFFYRKGKKNTKALCVMTNRKFGLLFRVLVLIITSATIFITLRSVYLWIEYNNLVFWQYFQLLTAPLVIYIFGYAGIKGSEPKFIVKKDKNGS